MPSFLHVFQLLIISVVFVSGCFITNCPPGGKRSDTEEKTHQCEQCGPPGMGGRCFGPEICCSPQFGCLIGGPITSACKQETHSPSLCHNQATSCDGSAETGPVNGQCGALGICCTPETCTVDEECTSGTLIDNGKGHHLKHGPLLLHHLMDEPESIMPLVHGPVDPWFYRRLIHSKAKLNPGSDSRIISSEPDALSSTMPLGPPYFPVGAPRLADYF